VIRVIARARAQIAILTAYYVDRDRDDAIKNLKRAVITACNRILVQIGPFYPAPRPYPSIARPGWLWLKTGSCWVVLGETGTGYVIHALFHESANIPDRMPR
jgi:hypothetical protein